MILFLARLLPGSYLPLIILCGAIAIILGLVSVRAFLGFIGSLLLFSMLSPFIKSFINILPTWMFLLICVWLVFFVLRTILALLLGEHGSGAFMGHLFYDLVRSSFSLMRGIFRFLIMLFFAMARSVHARRMHVWIIAALLSTFIFSAGRVAAKSPTRAVDGTVTKKIATKISRLHFKKFEQLHAFNGTDTILLRVAKCPSIEKK